MGVPSVTATLSSAAWNRTMGEDRDLRCQRKILHPSESCTDEHAAMPLPLVDRVGGDDMRVPVVKHGLRIGACVSG